MEYINKKTGAIISTVCVCEGEDWELVENSEIKTDKVDEKAKKKGNK